MDCKKIVFLVAALLTLNLSKAQNFESLTLIPDPPLADQFLSLEVKAWFPNSGCPLTNATVTSNEDTIRLDLVYDMGLATAICNSRDTVPLGLYEAGQYVLIAYLNVAMPPNMTDTDTLWFEVVFPTGHREVTSSEGLRVFPNPVTDRLHIETAVELPAHVRVYDSLGRVVAARRIVESSTELDMADYPAGTYTVVVRSAGEIVRRQVVRVGN